ncbi:hypothetical protein [Microbispora bryophytorum]|uniref:Uncharacterized protein n=1 Tax=Microbispora bryophytorum subsp. camponoti TaxID=1677852 RepID=A0ABR8L6S9_9ACTN|nr:hypothetical protein [Microbispora camponoti]MBD3146616.1 hypothetical protein [Microbispora camponoti]
MADHAAYEIVLSVEDEFGRIELVKVGTSGEPQVAAEGGVEFARTRCGSGDHAGRERDLAG